MPGVGPGQCQGRLLLHHTGPLLASVLCSLLFPEPFSLPTRAKSLRRAPPCNFSLSRASFSLSTLSQGLGLALGQQLLPADIGVGNMAWGLSWIWVLIWRPNCMHSKLQFSPLVWDGESWQLTTTLGSIRSCGTGDLAQHWPLALASGKVARSQSPGTTRGIMAS